MTDDRASEVERLVERLARIETLLEMSTIPRVTVSRETAAASLGISLKSFDRYVRDSIPKVRIGTKALYRPSDLAAWAEKHACEVTAPRRRRH
jgi:hypothetical protein